jgi:thymidylate kinase
MIDGIAGSGKSTLLNALKVNLATTSMRVFDMQTWNAKNTQPPTFEEIADYDLYFLFEPTKSWVGSAIREEISFNKDKYSARAQAEAFALDRMIQYSRLVIPALSSGKIIIQDRGVTTSLVYQGHMDNTIDRRGVAELTGNALALEYSPQHLILTYLDPQIALQRRGNRNDSSKGMYEETELLRRAQATFHSEAFCGFINAHGTQIHVVDTSTDITASTHTFQTLINSLITL